MTETKEKVTISIAKANFFGLILIIPILLIYGVPFYLLQNYSSSIENFKNFINTSSTSTLYIYINFLVDIYFRDSNS